MSTLTADEVQTSLDEQIDNFNATVDGAWLLLSGYLVLFMQVYMTNPRGREGEEENAELSARGFPWTGRVCSSRVGVCASKEHQKHYSEERYGCLHRSFGLVGDWIPICLRREQPRK